MFAEKINNDEGGNRMIYWELFLGFLKVGCFSFGGAYAAIPLIREVILKYGWITEEKLTYMIAVSESTPGPIMVNLATYIGSSQAGMIGASIATTATVLPAFFVILLIAKVLQNVMDNRYVQAVLNGIEPCVIGIILATGLYMTVQNCMIQEKNIKCDSTSVIVVILIIASMLLYKYIRKKKMSPILLIIVSAGLGILIF